MDVAELRVVLNAENNASGELDATEQGIKDVGDAAEDSGEKSGGLLSSLGGFGGAAILGGIGLVGGAVAGMIGNASEAERSVAQLDAALLSTGGRAGMTKDAILDLSSQLSAANGMSEFGDEAITAGQTVLLKFQNLSQDVFPQTTQAMVDMAARMGGDVSGAAGTLGKALNDPTKGLALLGRQGVTFSDEQKTLIASLQAAGDMAGAQKIILDQLGQTYGGAAAAAADTFGGKMGTLKDRFGEVLEGLGTQLLPAITGFVDFLGSPAVMGAVEMFGGLISTGITNAISILGSVFQTVGPIIQPFFDAISGFISTVSGGGDVFAALGTYISDFGNAIVNLGGTVIQAIGAALPGILAQLQAWGLAFIDWIGPQIPIVLGKLAELIGGILGWIQSNLPTIVNQLLLWGQAFINWIGPQIPVILGKLGELATSVLQWMGSQVAPILAQLGTWITAFLGWILPLIPPLLGQLLELIGSLLQWVMDQIPGIVSKLGEWALAFLGWVLPLIPPLLGMLLELAGTLLGWLAEQLPIIIGKLGEWAGAFLGWIGTDVLPFIGEKLGEFAGAIWTWITETAETMVTNAAALGKSLIDGMMGKVSEMWTNVTQFATDLWNWIAGIPEYIGDKVIEIGSSIIDGIVTGLSNAGGAIWEFISGICGDVLDGIKNFFGISSPSRVMADIGVSMMDGWTNGIAENGAAVVGAMTDVAADVAKVPIDMAANFGDPAAGVTLSTGGASPSDFGAAGNTYIRPIIIGGDLTATATPELHALLTDLARYDDSRNLGPLVGSAI